MYSFCVCSKPGLICRKIISDNDDAEIIVPLKDYNPGTNRKISSHVTATAKSSSATTPTNHLGAASHLDPAELQQVKAYQAHLPADSAV